MFRLLLISAVLLLTTATVCEARHVRRASSQRVVRSRVTTHGPLRNATRKAIAWPARCVGGQCRR